MYSDESSIRELLTRRLLFVGDLENMQARATAEHYLHQRRFEQYRKHKIVKPDAEMLEWRVEQQAWIEQKYENHISKCREAVIKTLYQHPIKLLQVMRQYDDVE